MEIAKYLSLEDRRQAFTKNHHVLSQTTWNIWFCLRRIRRLTPLGDPYTDVGHMCVIIMVLYSLYKVSVTFLVRPENYYYIVGTYWSFGKRDSRSWVQAIKSLCIITFMYHTTIYCTLLVGKGRLTAYVLYKLCTSQMRRCVNSFAQLEPL